MDDITKQFNNLTTNIKPIKIDYKNARVDRQKLNDKYVFDAIKNKKDINKYANINELNRVLKNIAITRDELLNKCENDDILTSILAGRISKKASRQGCKDEDVQIQVCSYIANKKNINITKLGCSDYRPTKDGKIVSKKEMKNQKITKDMCLKSFDAKITGLINGWIFAKVVFGNGGHQDNVFIEADNICEWVSSYRKNDNDIYVILIDTDKDIQYLKNKYKSIKNILIVNHYEFQDYLINKNKF